MRATSYLSPEENYQRQNNHTSINKTSSITIHTTENLDINENKIPKRRRLIQ